jgi:DNA-binding CsgD family transcriptional regulator
MAQPHSLGPGVISVEAGRVADALVEDLSNYRSAALYGPAGIGKSTTLGEVVRRLRARGHEVLVAAASETARNLPFGAFAALVDFDGVNATERISQAAKWLGRAKECVLAIDDVQLLDDESAALLQHLVVNNTVAVFATYRTNVTMPDALSRAFRPEHLAMYELRPRAPHESEAIITTTLGASPEPATMAMLVAAGEGNPFQLTNVIAASKKKGALRLQQGVWTASSVEAGPTVRERLLERIAAFSADELQLARALTIGGSLPKRIAAEIVSASVTHSASADGWIVERSDRWELVHALFGDAIRGASSADNVTQVLNDLVVIAQRNNPFAKDLVLSYASWMVQLGDQDTTAGPALIRAAENLLRDGQAHFALPLIEQAMRNDRSEEARRIYQEICAQMGKVLLTADPHELVESVRGMTYGYALGYHDDDSTPKHIVQALHTVVDPEHVHELQILDAAINHELGGPALVYIDRLEAAIVSRPDHQASVLAAHVGGESTLETGQLWRAQRIVELANLDTRADDSYFQSWFARVTQAANVRLGDLEPVQHWLNTWATRSAKWPDEMVPPAVQGMVEAEVALVSGHPAEIIKAATAAINVFGPFDRVGYRPWMEAIMSFGLAWSNISTDVPAETPQVRRPARHRLARIEYFRCLTLAAVGQLHEARSAALRLTDRATAEGRHWIALEAVHLAARIETTPALCEQINVIADRCDGPIADLKRRHVAALADGDADKLIEIGETFTKHRYSLIAVEAFDQATAYAYRKEDLTKARQALRLAEELVTGGVTRLLPAPDTNGWQLQPTLTKRESEVAHLAAVGATSREIGHQLSLSTRTVETHLQNAYRKLEVVDRASLAKVLPTFTLNNR